MSIEKSIEQLLVIWPNKSQSECVNASLRKLLGLTRRSKAFRSTALQIEYATLIATDGRDPCRYHFFETQGDPFPLRSEIVGSSLYPSRQDNHSLASEDVSKFVEW